MGHLRRNVPLPEFPLLRDQISLWALRLNDRPVPKTPSCQKPSEAHSW